VKPSIPGAVAMEGSEESFDLHVKLLMLGDTGVGKTCLLLKYVQNSFSPTFITTIGIDFKIKIVSYVPGVRHMRRMRCEPSHSVY
jgi:GTPase SAR1 family protein